MLVGRGTSLDLYLETIDMKVKTSPEIIKEFTGELVVGMPVFMSLYDKGEGVIVKTTNCNTNGSSKTDDHGTTVTTQGGYVEIIFKECGVKYENVSEYLLRKGVQYGVIKGAALASSGEIEALTLFSQKKMQELNEKSLKKEEVEQQKIIECRENPEHKHLTQLNRIYEGKEIAKNIRKELKLKFKGHKFSVQSDHNSVDVTVKTEADKNEVYETLKKFKITSTNNTEKMITEKVVTPFNKVFGCLEYLSVY